LAAERVALLRPFHQPSLVCRMENRQGCAVSI
jgi:hypothetical protein